METAIRKWGNSHGIRIPKEFINELKISDKTPLDISIVNDSIVITKKRKHKTLEERIKESGKTLCPSDEIQYDTPIGNEVW
jgi:Growth regulator